MEKNIELTELQDMKRQMEILQKKLETQEMVSEKMMRRAMKDKFSPIMRNKLVVGVVTAFMVPYIYFIFKKELDLSWAFVIFTELFMLMALGWTLYTYKNFKSNDFLTDNLIDVNLKILRMKRLNHRWFFIGIPFLIIFFVWYFIETGRLPDGHYVSLGGIVGAVVGCILGGMVCYKQNQAMKEVLRQIKEMID